MGIDPVTAAVVGIGAYSSYSAGKKQKAAKKNQGRDIQSFLGSLGDEIEQGVAEQTQYQKQANRVTDAGYQGLIDDANRAESEGVRAAQEEGRAALDTGVGEMSSRGLLGSSLDTNQRYAAARSTSRAISAAQIAAARLRGSATLGRAQAKAQGLETLGKIRGYRANQRVNIWSNYLQYLGNQNPTAQGVSGLDLAKTIALTQGLGGGGGGGGSSGGGGSLQTPIFFGSI